MFIKQHRKQYPMRLMCKILDVSRGGYYRWLKSLCSNNREKLEIELLMLIREKYRKSKGRYGVLRITQAIRRGGVIVNKKKVARIMRKYNIKARTRRKFKVTTKHGKSDNYSENLLNQNFKAKKINQIWTSDITYLWTQEGWLYLAVVLDVFTRKIVGWQLQQRATTDLVVKALLNAIRNQNPSKGLIFHSDRGSQYCSKALRKILNNYQLKQSMSRNGNCYDNAITETFFHTLKVELVYLEDFFTREEARSKIFQYIEVFYNRERLHSSLGYLTPEEFEKNYWKDLFVNVA